MKRLVAIVIALLWIQTDRLPGQTAGQPPVEACKPGNFTVIGYPDEFGPKSNRTYRVRIDNRFDGNFLTSQPVWVPVIQQAVEKWDAVSGADLSFEMEGLSSVDANAFDGVTTIAACGGGLFTCPDGPPPTIPPGPQPPAFAQSGVIAVTLISSRGGVDKPVDDADIFFNPEIPLSTSPAGNQIDFESVLIHELGHAVGLDHNDNCVVGPTVMESVIDFGDKRGIQSPEMEGVRFLYTEPTAAAVRIFEKDRTLRFDALQGRVPPFAESVPIYGRRGGRWLAKATTVSGGSWLVLAPPAGRFPADGVLSVGVSSGNLAPGDYTGTVSVNLEGHTGPAATVAVTLHVEAAQPLEQQPFLTRAGITAASNTTSAALAPGSLFTLFGEYLGAATAEAPAAPLPTRLGGTEVLVNGVKAPLLFVSPKQINGQIPAEVLPGRGGIVVRTGLGQTPSIPVDLTKAAPEFFLIDDDQVLALNPNSTVNSETNPAPQGTFISLFLTGQGPVTPPVASGQAAPLIPLSRVIPFASAQVGGQEANILFLGLAPGFVGLAQASIELPAGLTGRLPVTLTIDEKTGSSGFISVE
jgi:uncharacterized protein (TIGR03437 family)